jgi:hypothetical protein
MGSDSEMKQKRPFLIWLLSLIFFTFAFVYLLQVISTIQSWNVLLAIQYKPGPWYPLFQGLLLSLSFAASGIVLWLRVFWAPEFDAFIVLLASLWFWLDKLAFSADPKPLSGQIFGFVSFGVMLGLVLASLWSLKPYMVNPDERPNNTPTVGE